jgi:hypothetical protein
MPLSIRPRLEQLQRPMREISRDDSGDQLVEAEAVGTAF